MIAILSAIGILWHSFFNQLHVKTTSTHSQIEGIMTSRHIILITELLVGGVVRWCVGG